MKLTFTGMVPRIDLGFLDTSAIYALAVASDPKHPSVLHAYTDPNYTFILHELIFVEAFSLRSKRHGKQQAVDVVGALRRSARVKVVPLTPDLLEAGWQRCLRYADKEWDWIDCVSFELMERRGIKQALSLDRHFTPGRVCCPHALTTSPQ